MRTLAFLPGLGVLLVALCGCGQTRPGSGGSTPSHTEAGGAGASGAPSTGTAGESKPAAGSGSPTRAAGRSGGGGAAAGSGGSGSMSSDQCLKDLAVPAICHTCADGSCGAPVCRDGKFSGEWRCSNDPQVSGGSCAIGGCSNQLCTEGSQPAVSTCEWREEYACYRSAKCERQSDGKCRWTQTPELAACLKNPAGGNLRWFTTCGDPVCSTDPKPFDDPNIPNCTDQKLGDACTKDGELCDGVASCGAKYVCAAKQQTICPISRARLKQEIEYLDPDQRRAFRDQLLRLPLASYRYKHAPEAGPQLGFMIDDVEPSVAVSGDHVNLYGYMSMAVAAIQEQQQEIARLQQQLAELRARSQAPAADMSCEP